MIYLKIKIIIIEQACNYKKKITNIYYIIYNKKIITQTAISILILP